MRFFLRYATQQSLVGELVDEALDFIQLVEEHSCVRLVVGHLVLKVKDLFFELFSQHAVALSVGLVLNRLHELLCLRQVHESLKQGVEALNVNHSALNHALPLIVGQNFI